MIHHEETKGVFSTASPRRRRRSEKDATETQAFNEREPGDAYVQAAEGYHAQDRLASRGGAAECAAAEAGQAWWSCHASVDSITNTLGEPRERETNKWKGQRRLSPGQSNQVPSARQ